MRWIAVACVVFLAAAPAVAADHGAGAAFTVRAAYDANVANPATPATLDGTIDLH